MKTCNLWNDCTTCPFNKCILDITNGLKRLKHYKAIKTLIAVGYSIKFASSVVGISYRTVLRLMNESPMWDDYLTNHPQTGH